MFDKKNVASIASWLYLLLPERNDIKKDKLFSRDVYFLVGGIERQDLGEQWR